MTKHWLRILVLTILFLLLLRLAGPRTTGGSPLLTYQDVELPAYQLPRPAGMYFCDNPDERPYIIEVNSLPLCLNPEFWNDLLDITTCESKWDVKAVGKAGEVGKIQIHPTHFPTMRKLGLNPDSEVDRYIFAQDVLWARSGVKDWSCGKWD